MTNKFTIQTSPNFVGAYIVVNNETGEATPCRDLRNALAHIKDQENPQSVVVSEPKQITLEESCSDMHIYLNVLNNYRNLK